MARRHPLLSPSRAGLVALVLVAVALGVSGVSIHGTPASFERVLGRAGPSTRIAAKPGQIVVDLL